MDWLALPSPYLILAEMKIFALVIIVLWCRLVASGEDVLMSGGRAPDGHHEVRAYRVGNG
jgi:hypothetical protein